MWVKRSALFLVLVLLSSICFASPSSPPSSSVVLSQDESAQIQAALEQSESALKASNEEIATQSRQISTLSIFCGVLGTALAIDLTERAVEAGVRFFRR